MKIAPDEAILKILQAKTFMGFDVTRLRGEIQKAFMGYLCVDIIDPPSGATWGYFNDRWVDKKWLKDLLGAYEEQGVDNCADKTAIEVAIRESWIKNPRISAKDKDTAKGKDADKDKDAEAKARKKTSIMGSVEGHTIHQIPMMELTDKGKAEVKPDQLWMLGGNHRREALKIRREGILGELAKCKEAVAKIEEENKRAGYTGSVDVEKDRFVKVGVLLQKQLDMEKKWVVKLFDRGERRFTDAQRRVLTDDHDPTDYIEKNSDSEDMADAIFRLISRNETKSMHQATEEELLQELVDELKREYLKDVKKMPDDTEEADYYTLYPRFMGAIGEKAEAYKQYNSGFRKLSCMPTFTLSLVMASQVRRHYTHAKWFRMGTFYKMVEVHGAVRRRD